MLISTAPFGGADHLMSGREDCHRQVPFGGEPHRGLQVGDAGRADGDGRSHRAHQVEGAAFALVAGVSRQRYRTDRPFHEVGSVGAVQRSRCCSIMHVHMSQHGDLLVVKSPLGNIMV
jgi:hypothetical protein